MHFRSTMAKFLTELFRLPSSASLFKKILLFRDASPLQNGILFGRWGLDYDSSVQGRKVYWANMDNCGCCHHVDVKLVKKKDETENDEYILPYII